MYGAGAFFHVYSERWNGMINATKNCTILVPNTTTRVGSGRVGLPGSSFQRS